MYTKDRGDAQRRRFRVLADNEILGEFHGLEPAVERLLDLQRSYREKGWWIEGDLMRLTMINPSTPPRRRETKTFWIAQSPSQP